MRRSAGVAVLMVGGALLTSACATVPNGPSVMVLPGSGMSFEQFQTDDAACRQWGFQQTGITTEHAVNRTAVGNAAVGTVVGGALGAAIGAAFGNPAAGAAIGAGSGLAGGTLIGVNNAYASGTSVQNRFDAAYMQCMYAKGHQIPVARGSRPAAYSSAPMPPPAPSPPPPPPPPGAPPPPPPR